MRRSKIISIIIPSYNEEVTLPITLNKLINLEIPGWFKQIIVVDDGSVDESLQKIQKYMKSLEIIKHQRNLGKGAAIKSGLEKAKGFVTVIQDADREYDPNDIKKLLSKFESSKNNVIYGSRNLNPKKRGYLFYFLGGVFLTKLFNLMYKTELTDICCGCKLFKTTLLKSLDLQTNSFTFDVEVTAKVVLFNEKISEVPVSYNPRTFNEGKKISPKVALSDIVEMLKFRYFNLS